MEGVRGSEKEGANEKTHAFRLRVFAGPLKKETFQIRDLFGGLGGRQRRRRKEGRGKCRLPERFITSG